MNISIAPLDGVPDIEPGMDLAQLLAPMLQQMRPALCSRDVLVVAQKIVSKAESRYVDLCSVQPSARAVELAAITRKDPRIVEIILGESSAVVRAARDVLIVRHRLGFVMAQAGVDSSNVSAGSNGERVLLLPKEPQRSAENLRAGLAQRLGTAPGVIISDSFGRPWRLGVVNVAIGAAGVAAVWDRRGELDRYGRPLQSTLVAWADAVACAAGLAMGEAGEGRPAVMVRGLNIEAPLCGVESLIRPAEQDLFS